MKAVSQLNGRELDDFVVHVLAMRAQRAAPALSPGEGELLQRINQSLAGAFWPRYHELIDKRRQETLTPEEYRELLALSDEAERVEVQRLLALTELARLRQKPLGKLLDELGIQPAGHD